MAGKAGNALISVYDKTGVIEFANGLHQLDWTIYASGGTHRTLQEAGVPSKDVAELVGTGAILNHKVVTLSQEVAAGLLVDLDDKEEMLEMKELGYKVLHLVCQDPYPLEAEIADPNHTDASVRKQTDIGGPTMLREAAKAGRIVLSVPEQRQAVLEWLQAGQPNEKEFIAELAKRALYEVARYTGIEAQYWNGDEVSIFAGRKHAKTKYGENPHQVNAALYADNRVNIDPLGLDQFEHVQGMEHSFINETDIDRLVQTTTKIAAGFDRFGPKIPAIAVGVKHGNACGAGISESLEDAVRKMIDGDTRAIFGGVVMINGKIDRQVAEILMRYATTDGKNRLLDGVIGSEVTPEALNILSREKLRVVVNPALAELNERSIDHNRRRRLVRGGTLEQDSNSFILDFNSSEVEMLGSLTKQQKEDLILAWAIGSTSNSNTITIVKDGRLIGNGVGQQDRVGAGQLALSRSTIEVPSLEVRDDKVVMTVVLDGTKLKGAVAYSDSFFPFPDGPKLLADTGIEAMLTTWNTEPHKKILQEIHDLGVNIVMLPDKLARGFAQH